MLKKRANLKSINTIFGSSPNDLKSLIAKAKHIEHLDKKYRKYLPQELQAHCTIGKLNGQKLSLIAESAAWATRLRFSATEITTTLRQFPEFCAVSNIEVKIQNSDLKIAANPSNQHRSDKLFITKQASNHLLSVAENIENPNLRLALERLAEHHKKD